MVINMSKVTITSKIGITIITVLGLIMILDSVDITKTSFSSTEKNNAIGQGGEDNDNNVSQNEENSQNAEQNSMCVSGDSTSFSCNNLSSENIDGTIGEGPQGPPGPQSIDGKVYEVVGDEVEGNNKIITSTANCDEGDTVMSGGFDISPQSWDTTGAIQSGPTSDLDGWEATVETGGKIDTTLTATAVCFDNP